MYYNIDLRFGLPILVNILIHLLQTQYYSYSPSDAQPINYNPPIIFFWDYFNHQTLLKITLILILLFLLISIRLTLSLTIFVDPIRLRFGDFNLSLPLVFLVMASFCFPLSLFLYTYMVCIGICIFPWPRSHFDTFMIWLQAIPTFIIVPQQHDHQAHDLRVEEEEDQENGDINVFLGHA